MCGDGDLLCALPVWYLQALRRLRSPMLGAVTMQGIAVSEMIGFLERPSKTFYSEHQELLI